VTLSLLAKVLSHFCTSGTVDVAACAIWFTPRMVELTSNPKLSFFIIDGKVIGYPL
jgi:hypothetical protein